MIISSRSVCVDKQQRVSTNISVVCRVGEQRGVRWEQQYLLHIHESDTELATTPPPHTFTSLTTVQLPGTLLESSSRYSKKKWSTTSKWFISFFVFWYVMSFFKKKNTTLFKRRWALCKSTMLLCIRTYLLQWQIFRGNIIVSYVCTAVNCFHVILKMEPRSFNRSCENSAVLSR